MSVTMNTPILNEEGDGKFSGEFRDTPTPAQIAAGELGSLVTPDSVFYSVVDKDGTAINGIDNTELTGFTTSWEVELCGDDLSLSELETDNQIERYFFIKAIYGSCQDTNEAKFWIKNLKGIKAS